MSKDYEDDSVVGYVDSDFDSSFSSENDHWIEDESDVLGDLNLGLEVNDGWG